MAHALNRYNPKPDNSDIQKLLETIRQQLYESQVSVPDSLDLDNTLSRDLGLDSLSRVELLSRIEQSFHITLPDYVAIHAETPRDLLRAIHTASTSQPEYSVLSRESVAPGAAERTERTERPESTEKPESPAASQPTRTLLEALQWHVKHHPNRNHIQLCNDDGNQPITYGNLYQQAKLIAAGLQNMDVQPGQTITIMLPTSDNYFYCFFGILLAGCVPVPLYPPANPAQLEDHMRRHVEILNNCQAQVLVTIPQAKKIARLLKSQVASLKHVITVDELHAKGGSYSEIQLNPQAIAFIQYTSGSTGNPKGVVLSHANLLANIKAMGQAIQVSADDVFVSWLPLYHDMGLIGAWLGSVFYGYLLAVMSPVTFLHHPEKWLWTLHQFKGTISASPNFGYELCVRRLDKEQLKDLDISHWRAAFNGAETVSVSTMERFYEKFRPFGLNPQALMPVYGLAENSLGLTFPPLNRGMFVDKVDRTVFTRNGKAIPASKHDEDPLKFASCGLPLKGHEIRVVDSADRELPDRQEGRLQFRGPSSTTGYFRNAADTKRLFHGEWLDSGDLGYIANGEIFVTGRLKDVIIRAGRNIYPHELEECIGDIDGIRAGRVTAFGSTDSHNGTERLVIVAETRETDAATQNDLRHKVISVVNGLAGTPPDEIVLAPPNTILKTSSGKLRRAASRQLYENGRIGKTHRPVWLQILHFAVKGFAAESRKLFNASRRFLFGVYARSVFWLIAVCVWSGVMVLPTLNSRWTLIKAGISLLVKISDTTIKIRGLEKLPPPAQSCIYVANHASYLDAMVIMVSLPRIIRFVAKAELKEFRLARIFLDRLKVAYVDRFDMEKSLATVDKLSGNARQGNGLFFFPEGTFVGRPGLLPFHLGAFIVAATADIPVIPVTIRGTRSILRAETWLPAKGAIQVLIGNPLIPERYREKIESDAITANSGIHKDHFALAKVLRDATREQILKDSGEPNIKV